MNVCLCSWLPATSAAFTAKIRFFYLCWRKQGQKYPAMDGARATSWASFHLAECSRTRLLPNQPACPAAMHVGLQLLKFSPTGCFVVIRSIDQQVISEQRRLRIDPRCNLDSYTCLLIWRLRIGCEDVLKPSSGYHMTSSQRSRVKSSQCLPTRVPTWVSTGENTLSVPSS